MAENFMINLVSVTNCEDYYEYQLVFKDLKQESVSGNPFCCKFETADGIDWVMQFYPPKIHFGNLLPVSLCQLTVEEIEAEWEISMIHENGERKCHTSSLKRKFRKRRCDGFQQVLIRDEISSTNEFRIRSNETFTLKGKITVFKTDEPPKRSFSDIFLKVEGELIEAHKILLSQSSDIFRDLLKLKENQRVLKLQGVNRNVADKMVDFLYEGNVDNMAEFSKPLLQTATFFEMNNLKNYCQDYLIKNLTVQNVVETLEFAIEVKSNPLVNKCSLLIGRKCPEIPESNWEKFIDEFPDEFDRIFQNCVFENFRNFPKNNQNSNRNANRGGNCGCRLSQNFTRLFEEEIFSDAVLEVNGRIMNVHKLILSSRSSVLKRMIDSSELIYGAKEPIVIENFGFSTIREMLRYIYSEKVQNMEELVYDLLEASKEFKIQGLADLCGRHLETRIVVGNVLNVLETADEYGCLDLKMKCCNYFAREVDKVFRTEYWKQFIKENPKLLSEIFKDWTRKYFRTR